MISIPEDELEWRFSRASGPGGQGVNTTDSRVELRWDLNTSRSISAGQRQRIETALGRRIRDGVLRLHASTERSQLANRRIARARLDQLVAEALAPRVHRRATKPTKSSQRRRLEAKTQRGEIKRLRRPPSE
jgi:ribosome-associated protein